MSTESFNKDLSFKYEDLTDKAKKDLMPWRYIEDLEEKVVELQSKLERCELDARNLFSDLIGCDEKCRNLQSKLDEIEKQEPFLYMFQWPTGLISTVILYNREEVDEFWGDVDVEIISLYKR